MTQLYVFTKVKRVYEQKVRVSHTNGMVYRFCFFYWYKLVDTITKKVKLQILKKLTKSVFYLTLMITI
jgi:hypothetical protein